MLAGEIARATDLLGVLLLLATLFSSELARRLEAERNRKGGPLRRSCAVIAWQSLGLLATTAAALVSLGWVTVPTLMAIGTTQWEPVYVVFVLVWVLLAPLVAWQAYIALSAKKL
jgi:hypothetical protein